MQPLHRVLKALAEPTRLRILNLLLEQSLCVCELEPLLGLSQPLLSRHLAYLRNAGLVVDRRQGMRVQYSIRQGHPVLDILTPCLQQAMGQEEVYREDLRRLEQQRRSCCSKDSDLKPASSVPFLTKGDSQ